jgi:hypothetical protein
MRVRIDHIPTRAKHMRPVQKDLKSRWMWNEKTLDPWDQEIAGLQRVSDSIEF